MLTSGGDQRSSESNFSVNAPAVISVLTVPGEMANTLIPAGTDLCGHCFAEPDDQQVNRPCEPLLRESSGNDTPDPLARPRGHSRRPFRTHARARTRPAAESLTTRTRPLRHALGTRWGHGCRLVTRQQREEPGVSRTFLTPPAGLEPATYGLEVRCSIQLSYEGSGGQHCPGRARRNRKARRNRRGS
jgi:hypothetical protein